MRDPCQSVLAICQSPGNVNGFAGFASDPSVDGLTCVMQNGV